MFKDVLSDLQLCSKIADRVFGRCGGASFRGDESFSATLRAFVLPRMKDGDSVKLNYVTIGSISQFDSMSPNRMFNEIVGKYRDMMSNDNVTIVNISGSKDSVDSVFSRLCDDGAKPDGFEENKFVADFFLKNASTSARFYTSEKKRTAIVLVGSMDVCRWHLLQVVIAKILPWYFTESPILKSSEEARVLQSLTSDDPSVYKAYIAKCAEKYDFRGENIKSLLTGFENRYDKRALDRTMKEIEHLNGSIDGAYTEIADMVRRLRDCNATATGLQESIKAGGGCEVMNYFLMNKNAVLQDVSDDSVEFCVKYYLDMWDEDGAECAVKNTDSTIYHGVPSEYIQDATKFFKALFIDQSIKLKVCAAYRMDMVGRIRGCDHYSYPQECEGYMPNPHIFFFACLGGHEQAMNRALQAGNYIAAIEQCGASCRNLNFTDAAVVPQWSDMLFADDAGKWIELPDGSCVTAREAVKWVAENDMEEK